MSKQAIILLSGGLDSITVLAAAQHHGYECFALSFDYGQRHSAELKAAVKIAEKYRVKVHKIINIDLAAIGGSALTDKHIQVPNQLQPGIPVTYVPARNTIFLSFALGWAEVLKINEIFIGVNAIDYSGYPDCRPEFISAFQKLANLATKAGVEGQEFKIHTPLINLSKSEIICLGLTLGIDYSTTVSCYSADEQGRACAVCDACRLRIQGFSEAGFPDPTLYQ
jgi:7-cyano-7-deazaguanine synthase